jgi:hypothetical protein
MMKVPALTHLHTPYRISQEDGKRMKTQPYQEPMMTLQVSYNEVIAVGHVIGLYLAELRRNPRPTYEQREIAALLTRYQQRILHRLPTPNKRVL